MRRAERRAEAANRARQGREGAAWTLSALAAEEAAHGGDAWPFRREVTPEELDGIEAGQWRALLDLWPLGLLECAQREVADWPDEAPERAILCKERDRLADRFGWMDPEEAGVIAWARASGDFRDGLSGHLLGLAARLAKKSRETGRTSAALAGAAVAWARARVLQEQASGACHGLKTPEAA